MSNCKNCNHSVNTHRNTELNCWGCGMFYDRVCTPIGELKVFPTLVIEGFGVMYAHHYRVKDMMFGGRKVYWNCLKDNMEIYVVGEFE